MDTKKLLNTFHKYIKKKSQSQKIKKLFKKSLHDALKWKIARIEKKKWRKIEKWTFLKCPKSKYRVSFISKKVSCLFYGAFF